MASETTPKYPYVERVEVGYKVKPFEVEDTVQYYSSVSKLSKEEDKNERIFVLKCVIEAFVTSLVFFVLSACMMTVLIGVISIIIIIILIVILKKS